MTQVSLVKSNQSYQGTLRVLKPLKDDLKRKLKNLDRLIIKINFVTTKYELATTPLDTVKGFIDFVKPFFKERIIISEEASIGNTQQGFKQYGFRDLAEQDDQVEIFDSGQDEVKKVKIKYSHGQLMLSLAKIYTQPPFVVSICRAKTHDEVVVTLAIKNLLVGSIQGGLKERVKIHQGKYISWILTEIAKHAYPNLVIVDGVVGMQGSGPDKGDPIKAGWLIASLDALAADSLATHLMGFDIKDVGYLNLLHQAKFGKLYPQDKIEVIGPDPQNLIIPFKPHQTFEEQRRWY